VTNQSTLRCKPVKYIAQINGGREVTLICAADYKYWHDELARYHQTPADINGAAELWLSAVQLKWMGVRFSELSVSVRLEADQGAFLLAAFNTSRAFALSERLFFHTPYQHARVDIVPQQPESFALYAGSAAAILAKRGSDATAADSDRNWEGRVWMPTSPAARKQKYFCARLAGEAQVSMFDSSSDVLHLQPSSLPIVSKLSESNLRGVEWLIRRDASHARSKTFHDSESARCVRQSSVT
jgi:hypothetical protein